MAINNINNSGQKPQLESQKLSQQQQTQNQASAQKAASTVPAPRQDSVSLTPSAQQLNQVQKKSTEAPVNQEKVDRLKKAIHSGEYKINPEMLAQKIAKLEAEIFGIKS